MIYRLSDKYLDFPNPEEAEEDGLIAVGGDLSVERLAVAYLSGIFPWYVDPDEGPVWYSLDPRMVLMPEDFKYSHSLQRLVQSGKFHVKCDTDFEGVIRQCGAVAREDEEGTWISDDMRQAYIELHRRGLAHSFETYYEGRLAGGLYGVSMGEMFSGESMFHLVSNASKVAFAALVAFCRNHEFHYIDAQQPTGHLASLGAEPIPRRRFLEMVNELTPRNTLFGKWHANRVVLLIGGNQGDRVGLLREAVAEIGRRIGPVNCSSMIYETAPWGFEAEQNFLNMALSVDTNLTPREVLREALEIEARLGRVRKGQGYASRPMDIDIILYNDRKINEPDLVVPHPRMHLRRFVLRPLCDIMPEYVHPTLKKTLLELLEECPDEGKVEIFATEK